MLVPGVARDLPDPPDLDAVVLMALAEDLDARGDVTAHATVPSEVVFDGAFTAREPGIAAGVAVVAAVYAAVDPEVVVTELVADGSRLERGGVLIRVSGAARSVLTGERTALNLLSHLSGVATVTRAYVDAVAGTPALVRDTRKTLPGLRALQKAAVTAGGGCNHRASLSDGVLVKDNHVAAAGGVAAAAHAALAVPGGVQIEVDSAAELDIALTAGARSILLDNFALPALEQAVARCRALDEDVFVEASGGVTIDTIAAIAATGVDAIAVGALTHSVRALDIGLDLALGQGDADAACG